MRRFRASLIIAVLLVVSLTSFRPAAAGGPTSALLTVPGEGKTASLYYTDPEYDALARLVGIESSYTGTGKGDQSGQGHANGPGVTVTWLIHDVTPWRVDHIYPEGKGAPWIATQVLGEAESIWDSPVVWHQPESGAGLVALLDELGLGAAAREAGDFSGVAGAAVAPPTEAAAEPPPAEPSGIAGIWWAVGGLVAGVLATLFGTRLRRSKAREPAASAAFKPGDATVGTLPAEELSWPPPRR
jgi:hypothetical protein